MMKRTNKLPNIPVTVDDAVHELSCHIGGLMTEHARLESRVRTRLAKDFADRGGCPTCRGRGWIVVWDTLDSLSGCYAEFGPCPEANCTPETRAASGLHPDMSKYDRNRGVADPMESDPEYKAGERIRSVIQGLKFERDRINPRVNRGDEVMVLKGRTGVGEVGRVFWIGDRGFGVKYGIETAKGATFWVYERNCSRVLKDSDRRPR